MTIVVAMNVLVLCLCECYVRSVQARNLHVVTELMVYFAYVYHA